MPCRIAIGAPSVTSARALFRYGLPDHQGSPMLTSRLVPKIAAAALAWMGPCAAADFLVLNTADDGPDSLRAAIAAAAASADASATVRFGAALDGATITLTTAVIDLSAGSKQFGPSAFFLSGTKTLVIDGVTGRSRGVTLARSSDAATVPFRLFDVGYGMSLELHGLTPRQTVAQGQAVQF